MLIKYSKYKFIIFYKLNLFSIFLIIKLNNDIFKNFIYENSFYNILILIAIIFD